MYTCNTCIQCSSDMYDKAEEVLRSAIDEVPSSGGLFYSSLGVLLGKQNRLEVCVASCSIQQCNGSIVIIGKSEVAWDSCFSGTWFWKLSCKFRWDEAHTHIPIDVRSTLLHAGVVYHLRKDYARAEEAYSLALKLQPDLPLARENFDKLMAAKRGKT